MFKTIAEAVAIVVVVILLFLGSFRSVLMPVVTIPLSLIGVCSILLALGYSINLLSLLAMVLAIGLVVDDAIVVVENIHRHIEEGLTPLDAAIVGMKEITGPVIAMTLTLAAVLAPLGFTGGLTGALFREFAFTLAGRGDHLRRRRADHHPDDGGAAAEVRPWQPLPAHRRPHLRPGRQLVRAAGVELARLPPGDAPDGAGAGRRHRLHVHPAPPPSSRPRRTQGALFAILNGPRYATLDYTQLYTDQISRAHQGIPEVTHRVLDRRLRPAAPTPASTSGCSRTGPSASARRAEIQQDIQGRLGKVAGVEGFVFAPPSLPGAGGGLPITVVIQSIHDPARVYEVAEEVQGRRRRRPGRFIVVQNSLAFDAPQVTVTIDRDRAASLNVPISDVGSTLGLLVGGGSVGQFDRDFEQLRHHHPGAARVPRQPRAARPVLRARRRPARWCR